MGPFFGLKSNIFEVFPKSVPYIFFKFYETTTTKFVKVSVLDL